MRVDRIQTQALVLGALESAGLAAAKPAEDCRYVLIAKADDDSLSDRIATFHANESAVREATTAVPRGWWPDCVIDLDAPAEEAARDAAAADGSLGEAYPFDADHVVFV